MDDLTLRYYDAEMRYLLEAGEEFARAHPEQAAMLNLDKAGARDPFVERLFEGFAFLMGRMREKLDDDLPELTEGVVSLLWPHYLRTIPSMSVVEFTPDWPEMKEPMTMAKGFEVLSRPIGEKGTRCRYTTTKAIALQPLSLERVQLATDTDGRSVITLRFTCSQLTDWRRVESQSYPAVLQRRCAAGLRHARGLYPQCGPDVAAHARRGGQKAAGRVFQRAGIWRG